MNASSTTPSPFMRLPTEIKAHIVEMVQWQDKACRGTLPKTFQWFGKGLHALRLTNRELSGLASVHIFAVSHEGNNYSSYYDGLMLSSPPYRSSSLSKHSSPSASSPSYRNTLHTSKRSPCAQLRAGSPQNSFVTSWHSLSGSRTSTNSMSTAPSCRKFSTAPHPPLDIGDETTGAEDTPEPMDTEHETRLQALRGVQLLASRLIDLKVVGLSGPAVARMLKWSSSLKTCSIIFDADFAPHDVATISDTLPTLATLTTLTLCTRAACSGWAPHGSLISTSLRSLDLTLETMDPATWRFVCGCPNIEFLSMTFRSYQPDDANTDFIALTVNNMESRPFTQLASLQLCDYSERFDSIAAFLDVFLLGPTISPLKDLEIETDLNAENVNVDSLYRTLLRVPPTLESLDWSDFVELATDAQLGELHRVFNTHPRKVRIGYLFGLPPPPPQQSPLDKDVASMSTWLDWASSKTTALKLSGDEAGAKELLTSLEGLRRRYEIEQQ